MMKMNEILWSAILEKKYSRTSVLFELNLGLEDHYPVKMQCKLP